MKAEEFAEIVKGVTYKPGWELRMNGSTSFLVKSGWLPNAEPDGDREVRIIQQEEVPFHLMGGWREALAWIEGQVMRVEAHERLEWLKWGEKRLRPPHPEKGYEETWLGDAE